MAGVCTGPGPCDTKAFGTGDNWVNKVGGLDPYLRAVAHALVRKGLSESEAIQRAWGIIRNWAEGKGNVTAETRAHAVKSVANMERKRAQAHSLTADAAVTVDLAWNEALHPRKGGKFAPKGTPASTGTSGLPANMAGNVRDFQKRAGLPVTGVIDQATAAKIRSVAAAKTGRKGRKGAAAKARATQRRALGQQVSRVNSLSSSQRSQLRQRMPVPPTGYVWTATNSLRAVTLTRAQQAAPLTGI